MIIEKKMRWFCELRKHYIPEDPKDRFLDFECLISVERILIRGDEPDGKLIFTEVSPDYCDAFTL